jgi:hypothetical protein
VTERAAPVASTAPGSTVAEEPAVAPRSRSGAPSIAEPSASPSDVAEEARRRAPFEPLVAAPARASEKRRTKSGMVRIGAKRNSWRRAWTRIVRPPASP